MLAMCSGVSEETFAASGPWGGAGEAGSGDLGGHQTTIHSARRLIWRHLNKFKVKACKRKFIFKILLPPNLRVYHNPSKYVMSQVVCHEPFEFVMSHVSMA